MISSGLDNVPVYTDFQGLNKLRMMAKDAPDEAIEAVARQFEALFTQTLLKSMRSTSLAEGIFDSDQSRMYQDLFDKQISTNLSQKRGIGLADVLIRQLSKTPIQAIDPGNQAIPAQKSFALYESETVMKSVPEKVEFKSPEDYLRKMYPMARNMETTHGIPAAVILAQSALETGWGKHIMPASDGSSSHNLFSIKADTRWQGETTSLKTLEYSNGIAESRNEKFRSYASFEESMEDYAQFLKSNPRYSQAMNQVTAPENFTVALHQAGYATDPEYSTKINQIMKSPDFVSLLSALKNDTSWPLT